MKTNAIPAVTDNAIATVIRSMSHPAGAELAAQAADFAAALAARGPVAETTVTANAPVSTTAGGPLSMVVQGLMDADRVSADHWRRVMRTNGKSIGSVEGLLEKQMHMHQYTTHIEYVAALGRQAGKVVDQLVRTQ